jgi:hypothetical protein
MPGTVTIAEFRFVKTIKATASRWKLKLNASGHYYQSAGNPIFVEVNVSKNLIAHFIPLLCVLLAVQLLYVCCCLLCSSVFPYTYIQYLKSNITSPLFVYVCNFLRLLLIVLYFIIFCYILSEVHFNVTTRLNILEDYLNFIIAAVRTLNLTCSVL